MKLISYYSKCLNHHSKKIRFQAYTYITMRVIIWEQMLNKTAVSGKMILNIWHMGNNSCSESRARFKHLVFSLNLIRDMMHAETSRQKNRNICVILTCWLFSGLNKHVTTLSLRAISSFPFLILSDHSLSFLTVGEKKRHSTRKMCQKEDTR